MTAPPYPQPVPLRGVPQGPGVTAPFPAPPAEGGSTRLGWGLLVAGIVLVLCCGGGGAALVGFVVSNVAAVNEQARTVMTDYLEALRDEDYEAAYNLLCDSQQQEFTTDDFRAAARGPGIVERFVIGEVDIATDPYTVPVTQTYRDGSSEHVTYLLVLDEKSAQLEVCGVRAEPPNQ